MLSTKYLKLLVITVFFIKANNLPAQNLTNHQWKNRLILILIDNDNNDTYKKQLAEFKNGSFGLTDRKLVIYEIKPNAYKNDVNRNDWVPTKTKYKDFKKTKSSFEIILIGLDGGIKLQQNAFLSCETLFAKIDTMPMRVNEMKSN